LHILTCLTNRNSVAQLKSNQIVNLQLLVFFYKAVSL